MVYKTAIETFLAQSAFGMHLRLLLVAQFHLLHLLHCPFSLHFLWILWISETGSLRPRGFQRGGSQELQKGICS